MKYGDTLKVCLLGTLFATGVSLMQWKLLFCYRQWLTFTPSTLKYAVWSILPNADTLQENLEKYSTADGDFEFQALYLKILDFDFIV